MQWPPDYAAEAVRRGKLFDAFSSLPDPRQSFLDEYAGEPVAFINDWCWTVDPRAAADRTKGKSPIVIKPFLLYPKQEEAAQWVMDCIDEEMNGLAEKTRGAGATWLFCAVSVHLWLTMADVSIGWGSRKEMLVDRKGDMDSIFEKMRFLIDRLPWFAKPEWLNPKFHLTYMKCENPSNGSFIKGEAGDNIGRGGRSLVYFKDESAHYEHPELIEAALAENTNTQIDFSSVNGVGNIFHQNRMGGQVKLMVFDAVADVPWMTTEFLDKKKRELEAKGLGYKFEQEYMRDYAASVEGIVIPGAWVRAAIDAHLKLDMDPGGQNMAALDPMDEGGDTHALAMRRGVLLYRMEEWTTGDAAFATQETARICVEEGHKRFIYDAIGIGSGVKAEAKHIKSDVEAVPWMGSWGVASPKDMFIEGITNKDMFKNLKAQAWWGVRLRFERTFKAVTEGKKYHISDLIFLDSSIPKIQQLAAELSQPTRSERSGAIIIDKKPDGSKSPNLADALVMAYNDHLLSSMPLSSW